MKKAVISGKEYEYPEYIELDKIEEYFDEHDALINKTASKLKTTGSLLVDCIGVVHCCDCMLQKKPIYRQSAYYKSGGDRMKTQNIKKIFSDKMMRYLIEKGHKVINVGKGRRGDDCYIFEATPELIRDFNDRANSIRDLRI